MSDLISFDYAIKYLLKDKADYDIVEGFISALIAQEGYKPVKIKALLDAESNKESKLLKRSIADLIVEDEEGNNYIIEIDSVYTNLFLHKDEFNTSRLIVDNLGTNQDYLKIKKVFYINLLYFPFPDTKSPLHHGKVIFHEIDKSHPVDFHLVDRGMNIFDLHNIFPEYFVISIPLFDDVIKQEIDEWLYLMKHSEVKESFKSPYMQKVAQRLNILKMSNAESNIYDSYIMESMKGRDYLVSAKEQGREEGIQIRKEEGIQIGKEEGIQIGKEEGMQLAKIEMAKKMLSLNIALDIVAETTGLSMEEVETLRNE